MLAAIDNPYQQPALPVLADPLADVLLRLARFGKPTITSMRGGVWWCYVSMHVAAVGASVDVKSESDHPTPISAALQCEQRINEMIANLGRLKEG